MYESFFGLRQRPFAAAPDAVRYFPAQSIEGARQLLAQTIAAGDGPGLVIGAAGTGKTMLCHKLAEQFRTQFQIALVGDAGLVRARDLLRALMYELGQPYRGMDEGELRLALIDYLARGEVPAAGLLILLDEAQAAAPPVLEELRRMTNLTRNGRPRVRLVLAGGPALEEMLAQPKLESLNQRLTARCYLDPWCWDDTCQFVARSLQAAGAPPEQVIFSSDALQRIHRAADGIPRLVLQICDRAMSRCATAGRQRVEAADVDAAWAELQQLPGPWNESRPAVASAGVVEIGGELQDEPSQPAAPAGETCQFGALSEEDDIADPDESLPVGGCISPEPATPQAAADEEIVEEVVIDHYAALDATLWAHSPLVRSREGWEIARLIQPYTAVPARPALSVFGSEDDVPAAESTGSDDAAQQPIAQQPIAQQPAAAAPRGDASWPPAETDTAGAEDELIVLDDGGAESHPHLPRVRRMEYDQLFARLQAAPPESNQSNP